jgi:hypothetical protein
LYTVFRSIGATFFLAAAQSSFVNQLIYKLSSTVTSVDPAIVTVTGATELHQVFSGAELDGVIRAYAWGIKVTFGITIVACSITLLLSLCGKWTNVNAQKMKAGDGTD